MPTPFPTLTEMEKFAQKNNLQSLTSEFGDVENQDAIDAAQGYNKSEQERVSKNFYDAGLLNKYRELNSKKLDERNAVINMQRSLRGSAGVGSTVTDTGFAQTTMGSDYMPEFVPREAPKFQNLPKPEFQKATISRFNPNSGSLKDKFGQPRFVNFDGHTPSGKNAYTYKQVLANASTKKYEGYNGYANLLNGFQTSNTYLMQNKPDLMAEQYDLEMPHSGTRLQVANFNTIPTVYMKYAQDIWNKPLGRNGETLITARSRDAFDDKELRKIYTILEKNGSKPQINVDGTTTYGGRNYIETLFNPKDGTTALALGSRFSKPIAEGEETTSMLNVNISLKSGKLAGSTEPSDYEVSIQHSPELAEAQDILSLTYEIAMAKNPSDPKFTKYLSDANDLGEKLNWSQDKMIEYAANTYASEFINNNWLPKVDPQVFDRMKAEVASGGGKFKANQTYGLGDTDDYIELGLISGAPSGVHSGNNTASWQVSGGSNKPDRAKIGTNSIYK